MCFLEAFTTFSLQKEAQLPFLYKITTTKKSCSTSYCMNVKNLCQFLCVSTVTSCVFAEKRILHSQDSICQAHRVG